MAVERASRQEQSESAETRQLQRWLALIMILSFTLFGIVVIMGYAIAVSNASVAFILLLIGGAAFIVGALIGFLFGIPRAVQRQAAAQQQTDLSHAGNAGMMHRSGSYETNTNLEEISDWLTKILVGVGLTQLVAMPDAMGNLSAQLSDAMPPDALGREVMPISVVICYVICGFLFGYLWTRLFMLTVLQRADIEVQNMLDDIDDLKTQVRSLQEQQMLDAEARKLVLSHLNTDHPEQSQADIDKVIVEASPTARIAIFGDARDIRKEGWQRGPREKIVRSIPVFRALISADKEGEFDRNHGELGFALKDLALVPADPANPAATVVPGSLEQWRSAERELTRAIEIRDQQNKPRDSHGRAYEANRAICRIKIYEQQPELSPRQKTNLRRDILADLREAAEQGNEWVFQKDPLVRDWMLEYNITDEWLEDHDIDEQRILEGLPIEELGAE